MIKHGTRPIPLDKRDLSYVRTFGSASLIDFPDEYSSDAGLTIPDQIAEMAPYECTGYTTTDLLTDETGIIYSPDYTYAKTCEVSNVYTDPQGADIRKALKSAAVFGCLPKTLAPFSAAEKGEEFVCQYKNWPTDLDNEASAHTIVPYFNVDRVSGFDWFDSIRSALWLSKAEKRSVSVGTPWFNEWLYPQNGIISTIMTGDPEELSWHNWKICGWKMIDGIPYLVGKPWLGKNYGSGGFAYFPRQVVNAFMGIIGTGAFTIRRATIADLQTVKYSRFEQVLEWLQQIIIKLLNKNGL